jgi:type IV secretory pathway VirJ component
MTAVAQTPVRKSRYRRMLPLFVLASLAVGMASAAAWLSWHAISDRLWPPRTVHLLEEGLGDVVVKAPFDEPTAFFVVLHDAADVPSAAVNDMVEQGAAVAMVDADQLISSQDQRGKGNCVRLLSPLMDIAKRGQQQLAARTYHWPVIIGAGKGAAMAYLALSEAPVNTISGAVSIGFGIDPGFSSPLCSFGARAMPNAAGRFDYPPRDAHDAGTFTLVANGSTDASARAYVSAEPAAHANPVLAGAGAQWPSAIAAAFAIGGPPAAALADLPLIELPVAGKPKALVIFYSGDGGWRDIDKSIAEMLHQNDVAVVGIDSLRYFWRLKTPQTLATDLERIIRVYNQRWGAQKLAVAGYSFGSGVIPFAYNRLSPDMRDKIGVLGLLTLDPKTSFQISLNDYIGIDSANDQDVVPELARLPASKVACFYGAKEKDSAETACLAPEIALPSRIERPGGHHFDGNYRPIAQILLDWIARS